MHRKLSESFRRYLPGMRRLLLAALLIPPSLPASAATGPFLPAGPPPRGLFTSPPALPAGPTPLLPAAQLPHGQVSIMPGPDCRAAIAAAERATSIPAQLMAAIARVESGRYNPETKRTDPWPWTINAAGEPGIFATKAQAIAAVRAKQAAGVQSIDVGCMQVNLLHHPNAFASLEQAFDPVANARYAASFLTELHAQTGDWTSATARYHSATPDRGAAYQRRVAAIWPEERSLAGSTPTATPGAIFAARITPSPAGTGFLPPARADNARIIPLASMDNAPSPGRGLAAYRATPIPVASRSRG